jgi:DNA polymerase-1
MQTIQKPLTGTAAPHVSVIDIIDLPAITRRLSAISQTYVLDIETTGLNPRRDKLVSIQFGTGRRVCILDTRNMYHPDGTDDREAWAPVIHSLVSALCAERCILHNGKFDLLWLSTLFGVQASHVVDTMLQEQIIHGVGLGATERMGKRGETITVNLHDTAERYGIPVHKEERIWFIGLDTRVEEWQSPFPQAQINYMVQDILTPLRISQKQTEVLTRLDLQETAQLENTCLPALVAMEGAGCKVDTTAWRAIIATKAEERDRLSAQLQEEFTPAIHQWRQREYQEACEELTAWEQDRDAYLAALKVEYTSAAVLEGKESVGTWASYKTEHLKTWREEHTRPRAPKRFYVDGSEEPTYDHSPINLGSTEQLKHALWSRRIIVAGTGKGDLQPYVAEHPIISTVLRWKQLEKFVTAFGEKVLQRVEGDGRIYPEYAQIGAATGRMSCSKPNWQQIPSHEPHATDPRRCIIAGPGRKIIRADLPNIELRIVAELSRDQAMLDAFAQNRDLHSATAVAMFDLETSSDALDRLVSRDQGARKAQAKGLEPYDIAARALAPGGHTYRDIAKVINFGLVYGMSAYSLGLSVHVPMEEAEELMLTYFMRYPQLEKWLADASAHALAQNFTTTLGGRKRFYGLGPKPRYDRYTQTWEEYEVIRHEYWVRRGRAERQAKNAPIQGTNADIIKYALILLHERLPEAVRIITCVHDEVLLEAPEAVANDAARTLSESMYEACTHFLATVKIPPIETGITDYWSKEDAPLPGQTAPIETQEDPIQSVDPQAICKHAWVTTTSDTFRYCRHHCGAIAYYAETTTLTSRLTGEQLAMNALFRAISEEKTAPKVLSSLTALYETHKDSMADCTAKIVYLDTLHTMIDDLHAIG